MENGRGTRPMNAARALEVLTSQRDAAPRSIYRTCSGCWALVAKQDMPEHEEWHAALDVLAARALGLSS